MSDKILEVRNLKKYYTMKGGILGKNKGIIRAVDGVSFFVQEGETFGLVGESGCGKSTVSRTILRLTPASGGEIRFNGKDLMTLSRKEMQAERAYIQMVFQKPFESLNPRMKVKDIVGSPFEIHRVCHGAEKAKRVGELLDYVGLGTNAMERYPHEFSGGQRQRIGIARAIALNPKLLICDEPVSALDVSIQSQILNLLKRLQRDFKLSQIFISHNLSVVKYMSDRIAVMYLGRIVEIAAKNELYNMPLHPYTQALLSAIPEPNVDVKKTRIILEGDLPSRSSTHMGCRFASRCKHVLPVCRESEPELTPYNGESHFVACHLVGNMKGDA